MFVRTVLSVVRHELRCWRRDGRLWAVPAILCGLLTVVLTAGWHDIRVVNLQNAVTASADRTRWLNQGFRQPHLAGDQGIVVYRPLLPLAAVEPGVSELLGSILQLDAERERVSDRKSAQYATSFHRSTHISVSRVFVVVVPLALLLLLYDSISTERQAGVWAQLLASGAAAGELTAGKLAAALLVISAGLVPIFVAEAWIGFAGAATRTGPGGMVRVVALLGCQSVYVIIAACLILTVAARAATSTRALTVAAIGWLVFAVVAPLVAAGVAVRVEQNPHSLEYQNAALAAERGLPTVEERRAQVRLRLLNEQHVSSLRDLPVDPIGVELLQEERETTPVFKDLADSLYAAYSRQQQAFGRYGVVAPSIALESLSMALADTDIDAYRHFADAAERYRETFTHLLHLAIANNPAYKTSPTFPGTDIVITESGPELWAQVPVFTYRPRSTQETLAAHTPEFASLALWGIAVVSGLFLSVRRIRP